jgi:hypothetical protein
MPGDPKANTGAAPTPGGATSGSLRGLLDQPIATGADFVGELARSARGLADNLEDGAPQLAQMVRRAASTAETLSHDIRDKSVHELADVTKDFARRQPALFVGAAATAGFLLARFIKAGVSAAAPEPRSTMASAASTATVASGKPAASAQQSAGAYHDA